jgi:murein DD-endopeptidase MepM/ murein hydrolase activator NlpD
MTRKTLIGRQWWPWLAAVLVVGVAAPLTVARAGHEDHLADLRQRHLLLPVRGVDVRKLTDTFDDARDETRRHEALDIFAPRGTPVLAVEDGTIEKLFTSKLGGLTIYEFDPTRTYAYYYAHLDAYAADLREKAHVARGQVLGYVGTTGNAPKNTPHLHFAVFVLTAAKQWWVGTAVDPFLIWREGRSARGLTDEGPQRQVHMADRRRPVATGSASARATGDRQYFCGDGRTGSRGTGRPACTSETRHIVKPESSRVKNATPATTDPSPCVKWSSSRTQGECLVSSRAFVNTSRQPFRTGRITVGQVIHPGSAPAWWFGAVPNSCTPTTFRAALKTDPVWMSICYGRLPVKSQRNVNAVAM